MDTKEYRSKLLVRVRQVNPWIEVSILRHIDTALTPQEIELYANGSDADIQTLINATKKIMKPRALSPGREFLVTSWNSEGQSSNTSEGIQAAPTGQTGTSQLPGSSNCADDGLREIPADKSQLVDPSISWDSQDQSRGTSEGIQAALAGQIVTSQIPADKSIVLEENSQSSSFPCDGVPECSDVTGCPPSSSRQWPDTCHFYIYRRGLCLKGLSCDFSHGFGSSGKLEMEIRELLLRTPYAAVLVADFPWMYFDWYKKHLPVVFVWDPSSLPRLLQPLHTICLVPDSYGRHFLVLLDHYQAYMGYSADPREMEVYEGPNQIYIGFSPASRSICTEENVHCYFSQYGPVLSVSIPYQSSFGFVRFQYPGTVRLLLSEWNPRVPHFIFGAAVRVRRYIPKREAKLKNTAGKHGLENECDPGIVTEKSSGTSAPEIAPRLTHSQPLHSQMEIRHPEGGDATGSPDRDSADRQPSHSQVQIGPREGGEVPGLPHVSDGLDRDAIGSPHLSGGSDGDSQEGEEVPDGLEGDVTVSPHVSDSSDGNAADEPDGSDGEAAEEQIDDQIVASLPDVDCFYKHT